VQAGPCAFVFQNPDNQIVMPTVASEVALGTSASPLSNDEVTERVHQALVQVNMQDFAEVATGTLSGGQKQRTAIAAALAQGPPAPQVALLSAPQRCMSVRLANA
jgi:energy-coupling factor transporter ATP-binding protein EcfA2